MKLDVLSIFLLISFLAYAVTGWIVGPTSRSVAAGSGAAVKSASVAAPATAKAEAAVAAQVSRKPASAKTKKR